MSNPTGSEIIYALGIAQNGQPAATTEPFTLAQIAALSSTFSNDAPTNVTTGTGTTLTAAQLLTGLLNRTGPVANFTDTTDTAANIAAASSVGSSFYIDIKNATAFTETLTGGTGVTFSSSNIINPNSLVEFLVQVVSTSSVVFNHIFTGYINTNIVENITALTTVGAGTITGAGIAGTLTARSGAQSATAFTDTTDTAANIVAAQPGIHVGYSWIYLYQNSTNAPATITGGTGVTVSGITVVPANSTVAYLVSYTATNTFTIVGLGITNSPVVGTFTANGVTPVTVSNTAVSPGSQIVFTLKTVGGTVGAYPAVKTITPATGFTVAATASDTSVYNYSILG